MVWQYYDNIPWYYIRTNHAYLLKLFKKFQKQQLENDYSKGYSIIQSSTISNNYSPIKSELLNS